MMMNCAKEREMDEVRLGAMLWHPDYPSDRLEVWAIHDGVVSASSRWSTVTAPKEEFFGWGTLGHPSDVPQPPTLGEYADVIAWLWEERHALARNTSAGVKMSDMGTERAAVFNDAMRRAALRFVAQRMAAE